MASGEQKQPNTRLRWQRNTRGWSLRKVADLIFDVSASNGAGCGITGNLISRWERGEITPSPFYREKLCRVFGLSAVELGLLNDDEIPAELAPHLEAPVEHSQTAENITSTGLEHRQQKILFSLSAPKEHIIGEAGKRENQDMDKKRRELLRVLSIAGGVLITPLTMPELDWDRIEKSVTGLSSIDNTVLEDLAAINSRYWNLYLATTSKASVLHGVMGQLETLVLFLREPLGTSKHQQLCILSSELSQLAGEIFFDMHDYESAQACYGFATVAAKDAGAYDLWACSLVRHAFLPLYEASYTQHIAYYKDALSLLQGAHRLTEQGDSSLPTKYWVAAVEAEATSGVHDLVSCQRALDQAQGVLEKKTQNPTWIRFNGTRLPALQGACYVRLQQPDLAIPALQDALQQFPKPDRKRGLAVADLATALLQCHEVEQACAYIQDAIDIAAYSSSTFLRQRIQRLWIHLEPFADTISVRKLEQQIRELS
jgi:transcriptional regulator with XRE-family HTH domain/tetratricopeptide (TPR) repeat protein